MTWRFIDLDLVDNVFAAALFEPVMKAVGEGVVDDTVFFWRPSSPAIYIGFHQRAYEDLYVERCAEKNIPIIRRVLGGGTGYCDRDQVIYNVVFREGREDMPYGPRGVYSLVLQGLLSALRSLGIEDAGFDPDRFSVYANGRKISGSGQLSSNGVVNSSGSFLYDFDFESMSYLLKDPVKNLSAGVLRPEDGMTCMRKENPQASFDLMRSALKSGLESVLGRFSDGSLTSEEVSGAEALRQKYLSDDWVFRSDLRFARRKKN